MTSSQSDETLMLQYAKGDMAAFEQLYRRHKNSVFRFFARQCDDHHLAEELFQELWNKIIKARSTYQASAKFTTWLYQLARHVLIDAMRRKQVRTQHLVQTEPEIPTSNVIELVAFDPSISKRVETAQQVELLKGCLALLPLEQKEAFLLRHEAQLSVSEIAQVIGELPENIKSRIRYAMSKLKRCLVNKLGADHEQ